MSKKTGSVFGGILLLVGSCVGVGMLGLPIVTGLSGFFPSLSVCVLVWLLMTASALLLVEVNGWFSNQVNFLTMAKHTLGNSGKMVCWVTYLFLFYAVLVAYISGIGGLTSSFFCKWVWHLIAPLGGIFVFRWAFWVDHLFGDSARRSVQSRSDGF